MEKMKRIRTEIESLKGLPVVISKSYRGKKDAQLGVLKEVYPSFFTVTMSGRVPQVSSYNYSDILTKEIEVVLNEQL